MSVFSHLFNCTIAENYVKLINKEFLFEYYDMILNFHRGVIDQWMILFSPKFGATWSLFQNVCSYETLNNP